MCRVRSSPDMEALLGVPFLASEYGVGGAALQDRHIDPLGLDEHGSSVIRVKRGVDSGVVNQGLFYLSWLMELCVESARLARDRLGATAADRVVWNGPRLICTAGNYTRPDVHAVREHRRSTDWSATAFGSDLLAFEAVAVAVAGRRQCVALADLARPAQAAHEAVLADQLIASGADGPTQEQVAACVAAYKALTRGNHDWHFEVGRYTAPEAPPWRPAPHPGPVRPPVSDR